MFANLVNILDIYALLLLFHRYQNSIDRDEAVKVALEMQKKVLEEQSTSQKPATNSTLIIKLQREIKSLKDCKKDLEEQMEMKNASEQEKTNQMELMQKEHSKQIDKIVQQYQSEAKHDLEQLKRKLEEFENNKNEMIDSNSENDELKTDYKSKEEKLKEDIEISKEDNISMTPRSVLKELPFTEEENDNVSIFYICLF